MSQSVHPSTYPCSSDGHTVASWPLTADVPDYPPLRTFASTDVCVIGAGIAGLTTAYLLAREGRRVIVLDDSPVGDGQTGRTSAHLASAIDDRFADLKRIHGIETVRLAYQSHAAAIDRIEQIVRDESIDCDFARLDGYLFMNPRDRRDDPGLLDRERDAAIAAGAEVDRVDRAPLQGFDTGPALRFTNQARFHPVKYLAGLCRAIESLGGKIYCGTLVTETHGANLSKGEKCRTIGEGGAEVESDAVVVATNTPAPINDWMGIYTKQASYRSYVLAMRVVRGAVHDALYWDTGDKEKDPHLRPYYYVRIDSSGGDPTHELLIVGGCDHKTGEWDDSRPAPFDELEAWARQHFPAAGEVVFRWSGQVQEPFDGLAFMGVAPTARPNVYVITGDSGMGLTHATAGAMLVTDLICGRSNPWQHIYSPSRKMTGTLMHYVKENASAAACYADYLTGGEVSDESEIEPGHGAILRSGLRKLAVFRDESGEVHRLSAVCTHLGCLVRWNPVEKSWDCPCHGSRFAATGEPVMGPAVTPLKRVD